MHLYMVLFGFSGLPNIIHYIPKHTVSISIKFSLFLSSVFRLHNYFRHPMMVVATLFAALCVHEASTYKIYDEVFAFASWCMHSETPPPQPNSMEISDIIPQCRSHTHKNISLCRIRPSDRWFRPPLEHGLTLLFVYSLHSSNGVGWSGA